MKRLVVFLTGLALIGAVAWQLMPEGPGLDGTTVVARVLIEGAATEDLDAVLAEESLRVVSPAVIAKAISVGRLQSLPSFKDTDFSTYFDHNLSAGRWEKGKQVIEVRLRCRSKSDGIAALQAVLDAYVDVSDAQDVSTDLSELKTYIEQLTKQCVVTLESQVAQHEKLLAESEHPAMADYDVMLKELAARVSRQTQILAKKEGECAALRSRVSLLSATMMKKDEKELLSLFSLEDPSARQKTGSAQILTKLLPLFQQRKQLLKRVGLDHPDVLKNTRQIAAAREFLGKDPNGEETTLWDFVQTYVAASGLRLEMLEGEIEELEGSLAEIQNELRDVSRFAARERQIREAIATSRRQFDVLVGKIDDFSVQEGIRVEIVERPRADQAGTEKSGTWIMLTILGIGAYCFWQWSSRQVTEAAPDRQPILTIVADDLAVHNVGNSGSSFRKVAAAVRLARFCDNRNQVVIRGDQEIVELVASGVVEELKGEGIDVHREAPDLDSVGDSASRIDPMRVVYVDMQAS